MSGMEGCLAILLDESVKHYDLAQNQFILGLNEGTVWADVPYLGLIAEGSYHAMHALKLENPDRCP